MSDLFTQFMLARSRDDDGGWVQLLVLVVFAAIYALRSILKAKRTGASDSSEAQTPPKPTYRPRVGRGVTPRPAPRQSRLGPATAPPPPRYQHQSKARARQILRPVQAPSRLPEIRKEPPAVVRFQPPELSEITPSRAPVESVEVEPARRPAKPRVDSMVGEQMESAERDYLADILADYADPDQLRAAILHYEILGKPISLRDPSQQFIGL
jgi:hypothetical protein